VDSVEVQADLQYTQSFPSGTCAIEILDMEDFGEYIYIPRYYLVILLVADMAGLFRDNCTWIRRMECHG
jgi:hypothetical protein